MNERWYTVSESDIRPPNAEGTRTAWMGGGRGYVGVTESSRGHWEEVEPPPSSPNGWENYRRTTEPRVRLNIPRTNNNPSNQPEQTTPPTGPTQPTAPTPQDDAQSAHSTHSNHSANSRHSNSHQRASAHAAHAPERVLYGLPSVPLIVPKPTWSSRESGVVKPAAAWAPNRDASDDVGGDNEDDEARRRDSSRPLVTELMKGYAWRRN